MAGCDGISDVAASGGMEVSAALHRLGGVSDRQSLLTLVSRRELQEGLANGDVVKAAHNLYALPAADEAAVAARRVHGVVSHLSAALAWGWKVKDVPKRPMVTVARNRHPAPDSSIDVQFARHAAMEAESFEFHALPEAFRHDIRRYTDMARLGWLMVRFVYEDVMRRPSYVHQVLADVVALRQREAVRLTTGA